MEFDSPTRRQMIEDQELLDEYAELYGGLARILREMGVSVVTEDEHLMFTKFDGILVVEDEKMVIFEYYLPIDFNIPTLGARLKTIRLADPNCFEYVRRFCNEQEEKRKKTKNENQT